MEISVNEFLSTELIQKYGDAIAPMESIGGPTSSSSYLWLNAEEKGSGRIVSSEYVEISLDGCEENSLPVKAEGEGTSMWGEMFASKVARLRSASPSSVQAGWEVRGLIAKSNDDVRQEVFVMQMISILKDIFQQENVPVWIYPYNILSTSKATGLIELIPDSNSLDGLKKMPGWPGSLSLFFEQFFGRPGSSVDIATARQNYVKSMAGYSIVSYLLAIKDRHNGNIMMNSSGHIIHIDFGFVFGLAPGKQFSMVRYRFFLLSSRLFMSFSRLYYIRRRPPRGN